jgi:hypothetical protein
MPDSGLLFLRRKWATNMDSHEEEEVKRKIQYWEGMLQGMEAGLNVDVAEVLLRLSPRVQAVALEILKDKEREPWAWELVRRLFTGIVVPLIETFVADLRSLAPDKERGHPGEAME